MKKIILSAICIVVFVTSLLAQTKLLTMDEAMLGLKGSLATEKLKQVKWVKGADEYSFIASRAGVETLVKASATSNTQKDIVNKEQLNKLIYLKIWEGKPMNPDDSKEKVKRRQETDTLPSFPAVDWENTTAFTFECGKRLWRYDIAKKNLSYSAGRAYKRGAEHIDIAPNTGYAAYTVDNNICVVDPFVGGAITNDSNINIVNGQAVHRDEFGITKGLFWSPNGNKLAYYRMDQTMVTDYPVIDWTTQPAKVNNIKYPMAGAKSHEVTIGVFDVKARTTVFLKTATPADHYLTNVSWSPDEQHIYVAILNRGQNLMNLNSYNAQTGDFEKMLITETDEKYTEPLNPMLFVKNNTKNFIWQSRKDGWNHLYLYDLTGKLIKQITKGEWEVTSVNGFDAKGEKLFFMSTAESPITSNLYSVNINDGKISRLTQGEGTHTVMLNDAGTLFIDQFSSTTTALETSVYNTSGKKVQVLLNSKNPLQDYQLGKMRLFKIKADAGHELYCRMFKPINFDSTKKYPVVVYQYGGPHAQMIVNNWTAGSRDLWFQYMAERGFVVFTLDTRGSSNRGKVFEQATYRQLGVCEMQDQLSGVKYLKNLSYVDSTRMGLFGWSFGGFMTCSIMTRYPDVFKAAVAGGPVIDWSYYEVMYTERYMDTPELNPKGYSDSNVLNYVSDLKGKLLLIHGTADPVVVWQHSILFLKEAVNKKKQVEYFVYPGHQHNVLGKDRVHLYQKVTDYFLQNL